MCGLQTCDSKCHRRGAYRLAAREATPSYYNTVQFQTAASVVEEAALVADDAQAQDACFRSRLVQHVVDGAARRQQQFQRLSTTNSRLDVGQQAPAVRRSAAHSHNTATSKLEVQTLSSQRTNQINSGGFKLEGLVGHCTSGHSLNPPLQINIQGGPKVGPQTRNHNSVKS